MNDLLFNQTIKLFQDFEEVDAITLGGSKATGASDAGSDYDVYVYLNRDLSIEKRKNALRQTCKHTGLGKTCWGGNWDDCVLSDGTPIELNYERIEDTRQSLRNTLEKHIAWGGYTTCVCHTVFNSVVLHDPEGLYGGLVKQFTMPYPEPLRRNIISANKELLDGITPSYLNQIEKAVKRSDVVSINHRVAALLASYFDILFAFNRLFHPGEKKLIDFCKTMCKSLPKDFEKDIRDLLNHEKRDELVPSARKLVSNLDELLNQDG